MRERYTHLFIYGRQESYSCPSPAAVLCTLHSGEQSLHLIWEADQSWPWMWGWWVSQSQGCDSVVCIEVSNFGSASFSSSSQGVQMSLQLGRKHEEESSEQEVLCRIYFGLGVSSEVG